MLLQRVFLNLSNQDAVTCLAMSTSNNINLYFTLKMSNT
jgi:hypothetical protein